MKTVTLRQITLRRAGHADSRRLWQWRNDFATRQASRHRAWIPHGAHALWLVKVLPDPDRLLLIAEDTDVMGDPLPVGTVRLDRQGDAARCRDLGGLASLASDPGARLLRGREGRVRRNVRSHESGAH